uniref:Lysozyme n=1 Tax=Panagrellus redivivus TaxID=6233 RepID=A0A7E4V596_PANRE
MKNSGINVRKVWLQVTGPINWSNNVATNINFISGFIARAKTYGITVGIYTSWYDWQQITGATTQFSNSDGLWYWSAFGQGPDAEGVASFDDFRPFGGWTAPSVKQFALNEALCGLTLNRDIYPLSGKEEASVVFELKDKLTEKINVGGFV